MQEPLFVNLTQGTTTPDSTLTNNLLAPQDAQAQMPSHEFVSSFAGTRGGFRGGRSSGFRGGCRNGARTRVQCQICSKFGHDAKVQVPPSVTFNNQWLAPAALTWRAPPTGFSSRPVNQPYPSYSHKQPQVYLTGTESTNIPFSSPDSGATHHVTNTA
ncbi:hypothetical protein KIW84_042034 [Lathyrus oleraceus]|uniref:Uncharacterized protein n=1 Tax=Pisum sativum TaxID=3888 RepID=A0A9D4XEK1_PEA|nr:hypothetical protein KIW84_042034 [Pisum sativum]